MGRILSAVTAGVAIAALVVLLLVLTSCKGTGDRGRIPPVKHTSAVSS